MPQVKHMMYVDNPPEQYDGVKIRRQSQEILLAHLALQKKTFKPPVLEEVQARISAHVESQRAAVERLDELQEQLEEACQGMEKLRIQNEIAEEERKKAESEARMVREMNNVVEQRKKGFGETVLGRVGWAVDKGVDKVTSSCSVM